MPHVCDNNMYEAQTCALFYILVDCTDKCTGQWYCGSTSKDELPDPRGSLTNNIPSHAIEQANQEVQQDHYHSQHASNQASNA